jgi:amino acid permease
MEAINMGKRVENATKHKHYLECKSESVSPTTEITALLSTNSNKIFYMKGISSSYSRKKRIGKFLWAIFNTASTALGTGMLSFPYAYRQSGLIFGIVITFGSAGLILYCLTVILRCSRKFDGDSYQQMVLFLYGRTAERCLISMIIFINVMFGIAYVLVINSQVFYFIYSKHSVFARPLIMPTAVALAIPFSQFRSINSLNSNSIVGLIAVLFFVVVIIFLALRNPRKDDLRVFNVKPRAVQTIPIVFFAIFCHVTVIPATAQLGAYWPSKARPGKTSFKSLVSVCVFVVTLCTLINTSTGIAGYLLFGSKTKGNVLENLGRGVDVSVSRVCMILTSFANLPVTAILNRGASFDLFRLPNDIKTLRIRDITIYNVIYYGLILLVAMLIQYFNQGIDFVMSVAGSTSGVAMQIGFPSLFLWTMGERTKSVVLFILSICLGFSGLFITVVLAGCGNNKLGICAFAA